MRSGQCSDSHRFVFPGAGIPATESHGIVVSLVASAEQGKRVTPGMNLELLLNECLFC